MASLSSATPVDERTPRHFAAAPESVQTEVVLAADFGDGIAADYAAFLERGSRRPVHFAVCSGPTAFANLPAAIGGARLPALVLFLRVRLTTTERSVLDSMIARVADHGVEAVYLVGTHRVHLGDTAAAETEAYIQDRLKWLGVRTVLFRAGHVLSRRSRPARFMHRFGWLFPLVPGRLHGCFVEGDELFAAIERERRRGGQGRSRTLTLLGRNRSWREMLAHHGHIGLVTSMLTIVCFLLSLLLLGHLAGLVVSILARWIPSLRPWNVDLLRPRTFDDLLALCNPYNYRYVKVVGYNNGINHFGHRYPGRTIVSTVYCDRIVRTGADEILADCGATVRKARDFLTPLGQDLCVIPNYSYVALGTSFFVPIHGSASDYSCLADTITSALLYDPESDRLIRADRDDPEFRANVYSPGCKALLLRLNLRVKERGNYFLRCQELEAPTSDELLNALRDQEAANVEVRKSNAASSKVQVYRYYRDRSDEQPGLLEVPRDSIGRLWDRLEENPVTSFLMHRLTRCLAFHCELFFTAEEFAVFWASHRSLPLRKIQLRYIRRDGLPHSPFREQDCVSADMFMFRRHRAAFESYLKKTFAVIRANPGKHSM